MQGKTLEQLEEEQKALMEQGKAKNAPSAAKMAWIIRAITAMDIVKNTPKVLHNWTVGWVTGNQRDLVWTEHPINLAEVMDTLLKVHGHQVFVDGCFNADPHPGNILLLNDGRLGLVDFGQVGEGGDLPAF